MCLKPCAGCVPPTTFRKPGGPPLNRTLHSVLHTDRPSSEERSEEYNTLNTEKETLAQLGACLRLMSDDMGDNSKTTALPFGAARRGRCSTATPIVNDRSVGDFQVSRYFELSTGLIFCAHALTNQNNLPGRGAGGKARRNVAHVLYLRLYLAFQKARDLNLALRTFFKYIYISGTPSANTY